MAATCMILRSWRRKDSPITAWDARRPAQSRSSAESRHSVEKDILIHETSRTGHRRSRLSRLASLRRLLAEGYSVVAVDNLLTGRMSNIEHLRREGNFEFLQLDINRPFECGEVNYVFHFASPASPVDYIVHGIETLKVGSLGTMHALEIAQQVSREISGLLRRRSATAIRWSIRRKKLTGET